MGYKIVSRLIQHFIMRYQSAYFTKFTIAANYIRLR